MGRFLNLSIPKGIDIRLKLYIAKASLRSLPIAIEIILIRYLQSEIQSLTVTTFDVTCSSRVCD